MANGDTSSADKANAEAAAAAAKAAQLQQAANAPARSKEQIAADEAAKKADDARAKAADANANNVDGDTDAEHANVLGVRIDPETPVGLHEAQKFGNDPANPKYAPHVSTADEAQTVKLERITPDSRDPVYTFVAPEMVGDYMRAGWNRSDDRMAATSAGPDAAKEEADKNAKK